MKDFSGLDMTAKTIVTEKGLQQLEESLAPWIAMLKVESENGRLCLHFVGTRPDDASIEWDWNLSLAKWLKLIRECQDGKMVDGAGAYTCGLCMRFWAIPGCKGCPIRESTGRGTCDGTPHDLYRDELGRYEPQPDALLKHAMDEFALLLELYQRWKEAFRGLRQDEEINDED